MDTKLLISFVAFTILNVIIQTAKSILTIKGNKWVASITNAIAFGLYTYIVILTVCELPLWIKIAVVSTANLFGVFIVKLIEEKSQKDKLWKIECTISSNFANELDLYLKVATPCPYSVLPVGQHHTLFIFYCYNKEQSLACKKLIKKFNGKFFVTEQNGKL
jgi:hypothetical protein